MDTIKNLQLLCEISFLMQSEGGIEVVSEEALKKVSNAVGCSAATLFIVDRDTGKLVEAATVGAHKAVVDLIESVDFDMGSGFSAWVAKQRRSVLIPNLREDHHKHFRTFISSPLISGETLIGVMNLGHTDPNAFNDENLRFLDIVAEQFALLIERSRYERELLEKNRELLEAQEEIKKQQQQIVDMERFKVLAQMTASINHEINNPLTTVIGNIELLLMVRANMDDMVIQKLQIVLQEARRIAEITQKFRNMKRVVLENYAGEIGGKMIDIDSSSK